MKKQIIAQLAFFLTFIIFSCQTKPIVDSTTSKTISPEVTDTKSKHELIKAEKRKQSEADLPFRGIDTTKPIQTIAFGSCSDQDQPQPIWKTIESQNPDLFLFMGDNIYGSSKNQKPLSDQYRKLNKITEYRSIREKVPFMATWDDHDYGQNDGGDSYEDKENARAEFVKYWAYLKTTLTKNQKAIYHSKILGTKKNTVQVIMLDTRWDRSDLKKNIEVSNDSTIAANTPKIPRPYLPDEDKTKHILSDEQWNWLEAELKKPAAFRILVSSIQVIANDHQFEKWGNFPHEREKLFNLIKKTKAKNLVILSGDRHSGSIAKTEIKNFGDILDVTASGLNRPGRLSVFSKDATYIKDSSPEVNFGLIKIDWTTKKALVELRALDNSVVNQTEIKF